MSVILFVRILVHYTNTLILYSNAPTGGNNFGNPRIEGKDFTGRNMYVQ